MFSSVATADGSLGAAAASCGDPVSYICTVWIESGCLRWEVEDPEARCSIGARAGDPRRSAFSYNPRPDSDDEE
jgi:hypothetical protein